jgi:putative oxidoreductase
MKAPFLIGRIVFGGFFIYSGIHHFLDYKMLSGYAASKKVPVPEAAVAVSGALVALGGASILLGLKPKFGAAAVIAFLASVSPMMHDFWRVDETQKTAEMVNFTKNMALLGAALALAGVEEPWPAGISLEKPKPLARIMEFARRLAA